MYRSFGVSVIGMTNIPEAKLAREAEICYGVIALATDYDCWHETHDDVSVEAIVAIIRNNVAMAKEIIHHLAGMLGDHRTCSCGSALQYAIITERKAIPEHIVTDLAPIFGKYLTA
jgi:5'-methylthioadenosine phosphorylase